MSSSLVQFFSLCAADKLKLQCPPLTSTPVCALLHPIQQEEEACPHCSSSTQYAHHLTRSEHATVQCQY